MEDNTKNENESVDGIEVSSLDVHMLDLEVKSFLEKIMTSNIIRGAGTLLVLALGLMFGIMFLIGSVGLLKSKSGTENVAAVESVEEGAVEESEEESEEE